MPTAPTAFAEATKITLNNNVMRNRVLSLYRRYLRHSPTFVELYELDLPVAAVRTKIRQEFERNRFQKDINIINILYAKGQMEFQELVNFWKQNAHVMRYFENDGQTRFNEKVVPDRSFATRFLKGYN
ncbi:hypothetical protein WICMUC_003068 [Wickerhamomyces mucosus]|uniref:Complex 1 LYR protein domain-containing protein n=1 Tax=Wickerhamomyces mucosus TaxID=1378264 RepID=A0A9P8PNS4_9ASCO|nr:hypothetical protein WICMUC_003068 [Wickerhamomyces mucosus]